MNIKRKVLFNLIITNLFCCIVSYANIRLPKLISDGLILQRNTPIKIWGWADPGEKIVLNFNKQSYNAITDNNNRWSLTVPAMPAGGPYEMTFKGNNEINVKDILFGDVFICSGQSNMEIGMVNDLYKAEVETSLNPSIRHFRVKHAALGQPAEDVETERGWQSASPSTVKGFSAVAYFFARSMFEKYKVPIGLITSTWGGTVIELWMSADALKPFPNYDLSTFYTMKPENNPSALYNGMINTLLNVKFTSVLWYQGEFNKSRAYEYRAMFPAMIKDWRSKFGVGDFPFVFVQLPNYDPVKTEPGDSEVAELREAQAMALSLPQTAMAVTVETNSTSALHPLEKKPIGERLALAVRKLVYKEKIVAAGPVLKSSKISGNKVILQFDNTGSGLVAKDGDPAQFTIAGSDRKFFPAQAVIVDKKTIEVSCPDVKEPVAVRYAWADNPVGANLYNKEGLPAGTFRTDDWPGKTYNKVGHTPVQAK